MHGCILVEEMKSCLKGLRAPGRNTSVIEVSAS